jgi:DtxR family Mn-dependent transcriptional regulator
MLKKLSAANPSLVVYEPYGGVTLTPDGERKALEVIRHHRLIECFLNQALGYTWDEVHAEAERLEHVISEELEERIAAHLGHPRLDPHGDPIPDREGNVVILATQRLSELSPGQTAVVQRVSSRDPELLRYLDTLGLTLDAHLEVMEKGPFNGPLMIRVTGGHAGLSDVRSPGQVTQLSERIHALGREVTDQVFVILESNQ